MSKNNKESSWTNDEPATAVDFIFRTMIEREGAPGKRRIRPKNVEELIHSEYQELGSDEDPDFDVSKDKHHGESDISMESDDDSEMGKKSDGNGGDDDDSEDEDDHSYNGSQDEERSSDSDSENEGSSSSNEEESSSEDDSQSPMQKKSALRETLQKLNDSDFTPQQKRKRKRPKKATTSGTTASASKTKTATKKSDESKTSTKKKKGKSDADGGGGTSSKSKSEDRKSSKKTTSSKNKKVTTSKAKAKIKDEGRSKRKKKTEKNSGYESITDMCFSLEQTQKENRKQIDLGNPICSACLGNKSDGMNEIVECDSCGITVHEGCYGVSDTLSVSSGSGSSCSTEPWFCDACKTGAKSIACELCPMKGGLFKETTAGRWVHLVCALYTPGVVIGDNGLPGLFDIPYAKYGAHPCSVCEDIRYSRTGVCVPCDAGMCKTYLHVTCAQKQGLLSDPIVPDGTGVETEADPYYAACKLHTNRETSKRRAKSYGILQEQLRIKREQKLSENLSPQERYNQVRIKRKLERIRFKVAIKQAHSYTQVKASTIPFGTSSLNSSVPGYSSMVHATTSYDFLPQSWKEGQKKSRLLSTSAGSTGSFIRKANLMGLDVKALELEDKNARIVTSVKRKWNIMPSMSVEFAAYYADRELRITNLSEQCDKLGKENNELNHKQSDVQGSYDTQCVNTQEMSEDTERVRNQLLGLSEVLKGLCHPSNDRLLDKLEKIDKLPETAESRQRSWSGKGAERATPPKSPGPGTGSKKGRLAIATCAICSRSDEQHLITRCDHCKQHYHLKCLDPPLTRMPKRSRLCGWMCSDCGEEEPETEEPNVDTEAPRTLRGRTKIRKPGKYRNSTESMGDEVKIVGSANKGDKKSVFPLNSHEPEVSRTAKVSYKVVPASRVKIEPGLSSPALTNGNTKPSKRRQASGASSITIGQVISPNMSLPSAPVAKQGPLLDLNTETKREMVSPTKLPSSTQSPPTNKSLLEGAEPKVKKPRKKRQKKDEDTTTSTMPDNKLNVTKSPPTEKKPRGGRKSKEPVPLTLPGQEEPKVKKKRNRKKKTDIKEEADVKVLKETPQKPAQTKQKKKAGKDKSIVQDPDPTDTPVKKPRVRKPRKPKVSEPVISTVPKDEYNFDQSMDDTVNNVGVFSPEFKTNDAVFNGNVKATKRRKASAVSAASSVDSSATTTPNTSLGGGKGSAEKSVPPKKRKRVTSTPQELNHQLAIIDAVARNCGGESLGDKNGISAPASSVIMQGVAPTKSQWSNNADANDHSIMKGHAMGSSSKGGEVVTLNASDLIDMINSTSTSQISYSPGFYSSACSTTTVPTSLSYNITNPLASHGTPSAVKFNNSTKESMNPPATSGSSSRLPWGQPQESSQNLIRLHYESGPVSVPAYSAPTYTAPSSLSSGPNGKCAACRKDDSKKSMVTCDKCAQDFHFMCLTPPLKYSPRRRGYSWYCIGCDDDESAASGQENGINSP